MGSVLCKGKTSDEVKDSASELLTHVKGIFSWADKVIKGDEAAPQTRGTGQNIVPGTVCTDFILGTPSISGLSFDSTLKLHYKIDNQNRLIPLSEATKTSVARQVQRKTILYGLKSNGKKVTDLESRGPFTCVIVKECAKTLEIILYDKQGKSINEELLAKKLAAYRPCDDNCKCPI